MHVSGCCTCVCSTACSVGRVSVEAFMWLLPDTAAWPPGWLHCCHAFDGAYTYTKTGTKTLIPKECQASSNITNVVSPDSSPIFQAVRAFITGDKGSLPLTAEWKVDRTPCEPACKSGTCVKVRMHWPMWQWKGCCYLVIFDKSVAASFRS